MLKHIFTTLAVAVLAIATVSMPSRAEQVPEATLKGFAAVMPPAPAGYTRNEAVGAYSSASASTVTATYKSADGTKSFSVVVTFAANIAKQNKDMLTNKSQQNMFGMQVEKVKGKDVLVRKPENKNKFTALYLVVLTDIRMLSITDATGTTDPAVVKAVFEAADWDAIAKK